MAEPEFRVTVEDLAIGETSVMEVCSGDYVLTTFEPCLVAHTQTYANGTRVITIRNHRPAGPARTVLEAGTYRETGSSRG